MGSGLKRAGPGGRQAAVRLPLAGSRIASLDQAWRSRIPISETSSGSFDQDTRERQTLAAAFDLERKLARLARTEARGRYIQAQLVAALLSRRGYQALGFALAGDYATERLGLQPSTLKKDASVAAALKLLPEIDAALVSHAISWTHARLLVSIADASSERSWLALVRTHSSRKLAELVAAARKTGCAEVPASDACAESSPKAAGTDGHATLEERVAAMQDGCWPAVPAATDGHAISEEGVAAMQDGCRPALSAEPVGTGSGVASDADVAAASEAPDDEPLLPWDMVCSRFGRQLWRATFEMASRVAGARIASWQALEAAAAEAMGGHGHDGDADHRAAEPPPEPKDAGAMREEAEVRSFEKKQGTSEGFSWLPRLGSADFLSPELEALLDHVDGADAFELDRRLGLLRRIRQRCDSRLGALLRQMADQRLFTRLGFANFKLYARIRLGMSAGKACALVRLDRAVVKSPALGLIYGDGEVSWLAAMTLIPVMGIGHDGAWIDHARSFTLRRLRDEVSWAQDRMDDPAGDRCQPPPAEGRNVCAEALARLDPVEVQMRACCGTRPLDSRHGPAARIALRAPASVIVLVEEAIASCRRPGERRWQAFERMLAHAFSTWMALPKHRDPVFARDNYKCQVPGCSSRSTLEDHHIVFRSHCGSGELRNRLTLCAWHHHHGIHEGRIRAAGFAPDRVAFELGCRPGMPPVIRTIGERYLDR